ncbi:MAG: CinA family nicotinamide mononucleotide deamidase-related protein [Rikenellaceae bacterium]
MATAQIITIGDELLIGQVVDTNSAFIGQQFSDIGLPVVRRLAIGDRAEDIYSTLDHALREADVVIVTGGLGPTKDDITKHTLSRLFDSPLVRDAATFEHVRDMVERRGIEFNESNQSQADVPACCEVLKNENGSAPGMVFERDGHFLFSLPGVPFEMKRLITDRVIPYIESRFSLRSVVHRSVITFGLPESILSERIESWELALPSWIRLAYLPNASAIRLRLSAYDVDRDVAQAEFEKQFQAVRELIGESYLGDEPCSVESSLAAILLERGATLSVAESCTGGTISRKITSMEGASSYYLAGVTSYSNEMKRDILGVSWDDIMTHGAVSQQVAEQMAMGVRRVSGSDYSIATTGIAGSTGGSDQKPVGTIWIAVATPEGVISQRLQFGQLREQNMEKGSVTALNMLRCHLLGCSTLQMTIYL